MLNIEYMENPKNFHLQQYVEKMVIHKRWRDDRWHTFIYLFFIFIEHHILINNIWLDVKDIYLVHGIIWDKDVKQVFFNL